MLKVDYDAINGKRVLLISVSLFCILFLIWISSFFGMLYSVFPLGDNMYMFRHIGVLSSATPIPVFLYSIFLNIFGGITQDEIYEDRTTKSLTFTVVLTIALVVFYAKDF